MKDRKIGVQSIRPDAAMVYAVLIRKLRDGGLSPGEKSKILRKALRIRSTLTGYEIKQARKLLGYGT